MRWYFTVCGLILLGSSVASAIAAQFFPRYHRQAQAMGTRWWHYASLGVMGGVSLLIGITRHTAWGLVMLLLVPAVVASRRQIERNPDASPVQRRMIAIPINPLTQLRHPVRTFRQQRDAFGHPVRSHREHKAWLRERGLD